MTVYFWKKMFGVVDYSASDIAINEGFFSIRKKLRQFIGNIWRIQSLIGCPIVNNTFYGRSNPNQQSKCMVEEILSFPDGTKQV